MTLSLFQRLTVKSCNIFHHNPRVKCDPFYLSVCTFSESAFKASLWHQRSLEKNAAYDQQMGHLLRLPRQGVNDGHDVVEDLVLTRGEEEHTEEETSTAKR